MGSSKMGKQHNDVMCVQVYLVGIMKLWGIPLLFTFVGFSYPTKTARLFCITAAAQTSGNSRGVIHVVFFVFGNAVNKK